MPEYHESVVTVRETDIGAGWERWFLLISDVHWDNPHCDRRLLERHLEQAKEREAGILSLGDWFCAMQGKYDPRASKDSIRPEHQGGNYLDLLVDTAADYLEPYAGLIVMLGDGNHETSIKRKLETSLTDRLADKLGLISAGYSGFVRFLFSRDGGDRSSKVLYWHHGHGGGGPVTKGIIQTNRRSAMLGNADVVVTGHIHEQWMITIPQLVLSAAGRIYQRNQYHVCTATYKQEYTPSGGWHVERGAPPKPLGGWWLIFRYDRSHAGNIATELRMAQ